MYAPGLHIMSLLGLPPPAGSIRQESASNKNPGQATRTKDVSRSVRSFEHELDIVHSMTLTNGGVSPPEEAAKAAMKSTEFWNVTMHSLL
jgi:hypothetical protein